MLLILTEEDINTCIIICALIIKIRITHTHTRACSVCVQSLQSRLLSVIPWTIAHQSPLSLGIYRREYCCGLPFSTPGDLPNPGIKLASPALMADSLLCEPSGKHRHIHRNKTSITINLVPIIKKEKAISKNSYPAKLLLLCIPRPEISIWSNLVGNF